MERREPAHGAGEVHRRVEGLATMAFKVKAQRETVDSAARTSPFGCCQNQGGQQHIVDPPRKAAGTMVSKAVVIVTLSDCCTYPAAPTVSRLGSSAPATRSGAVEGPSIARKPTLRDSSAQLS